MDEPLGLGILGCGVISATYLEALRASGQSDWRLVAVCDVDAEKARAAAGEDAAAYADLDRLLADRRVDAVVVLLPNYLHADATVRALGAGKPVLVEKPMATTLEDCDRMIAAADQAGKVLMVGMTNRFRLPFRTARARLRAGEFGSLTFIADAFNYRPAPDYRPRAWLTRPETVGGGMFTQMGIHSLDRAIWLAGAAPAWAHAVIRNVGGIWPDDTGLATLGLADGTHIQFQTDGLAMQRRNECVLHCSEATVAVTGRQMMVYRRPEPEVQTFEDNPMAQELREFAAAVRSGGPSPLDGREGRVPVAICLACYESSRAGRVVRLDEPPWSVPAPARA
ncbi:MAG: Gfo/Idh/MocA family oxidoreductase [Armatimonadetes bacterium]|nr:Gfo/Idh/MocA family oxidoreductase [Armatimonadota bacterium]